MKELHVTLQQYHLQVVLYHQDHVTKNIYVQDYLMITVKRDDSPKIII